MGEIIQAVHQQKQFSSATLIVTFDSAGGQLAAIIGQALQLPYLIARKKQFALPDEISFNVTTNFNEKKFYLYGDISREKILIVDDVVASGTTIKNAALAVQAAGAEVIAFFAIAAKNNLIGRRYQDIIKDQDIPLISMLQIQVLGDKVKIL
jgi:adenine phosphoribosyltransferase